AELRPIRPAHTRLTPDKSRLGIRRQPPDIHDAFGQIAGAPQGLPLGIHGRNLSPQGGQVYHAGPRRPAASIVPGTRNSRHFSKTEHNAVGRFPEPGDEELLAGPSRNFQVFEPLDFLAEVIEHIPDPGEHLIRYYGWYSNKTRGQRAQRPAPASDGAGIPVRSPTAREARQGWVPRPAPPQPPRPHSSRPSPEETSLRPSAPGRPEAEGRSRRFWGPISAGFTSHFTLNSPLAEAMLPPDEEANAYQFYGAPAFHETRLYVAGGGDGLHRLLGEPSRARRAFAGAKKLEAKAKKGRAFPNTLAKRVKRYEARLLSFLCPPPPLSLCVCGARLGGSMPGFRLCSARRGLP
ncbi:MAG: hypothetical protein FJ387_25525, partial [Verrucomicrobia bacterium]|nr:hypothetical protein [Verrucomicrobiota bacterium]